MKFSRKRSYTLLQTMLCLLIFSLSACESGEGVSPSLLEADRASEKKAMSSLVYGPATVIGEGSARVWVELVKGKPVAIGIEMTEELVQSLDDHMFDIALKLPGQAHATGYKTITIGWNPHGHDPDPIYTHPHFDFHFYMQTEGQIKHITAGVDEGAYALLAKGVFPPFYGFGPPGSVPFAAPHMGVHWVNFLSPEFNGDMFTKTFIYGSHEDRVTFLEPMVTLAYLESLNEGAVDEDVVHNLMIYEDPGYYPNTYTISHTTDGTYRIALTDLEWHNRHR